MTEERAAQILNFTIAILLGALVLGFLGWSVATQFGDVRAIYGSLPSRDRLRVVQFLNSVVLLVLGACFALRFIVDLLKRWRTRRVGTTPHISSEPPRRTTN